MISEGKLHVPYWIKSLNLGLLRLLTSKSKLPETVTSLKLSGLVTVKAARSIGKREG